MRSGNRYTQAASNASIASWARPRRANRSPPFPIHVVHHRGQRGPAIPAAPDLCGVHPPAQVGGQHLHLALVIPSPGRLLLALDLQPKPLHNALPPLVMDLQPILVNQQGVDASVAVRGELPAELLDASDEPFLGQHTRTSRTGLLTLPEPRVVGGTGHTQCTAYPFHRIPLLLEVCGYFRPFFCRGPSPPGGSASPAEAGPPFVAAASPAPPAWLPAGHLSPRSGALPCRQPALGPAIQRTEPG